MSAKQLTIKGMDSDKHSVTKFQHWGHYEALVI